jgi:hypothetical protein
MICHAARDAARVTPPLPLPRYVYAPLAAMRDDARTRSTIDSSMPRRLP